MGNGPWFYVVGWGTVDKETVHGYGILYQCIEKIRGSDYDKLRGIIENDCEEVGKVGLRGNFKPMAIKSRGFENGYEYVDFIIHLTRLDNILNFSINEECVSTVLHYHVLKYFTRIYRASDHLRITVPKSILPSGIDFTGRITNVELKVENRTLIFNAKVRAGRRKGKVLYYFIRIPRRKLRKWRLSEDWLVNREAKVRLLIPINPWQVEKHQ